MSLNTTFRSVNSASGNFRKRTAQCRGASTISDRISTFIVAVFTIVLGVIGFVNSFAKVAEAAQPSFGSYAWTVPIGIDIGIAIFSILDIVLARLDMRMRFLRIIPWTLTAATIYLNLSGETSLFGLVAHTVPPMLWVVAVEVGAHVLRKRAGLTSETRMRWFLAPFTTLSPFHLVSRCCST